MPIFLLKDLNKVICHEKWRLDNMLVNVNDVDLFYEKTGSGAPFILLHGNSESHKIFDDFAGKLSQHYTVYAIDSRCHGQSTMTQNIGYDVMVIDVVSFIRELGLEKPILMGFSDGGIIGLLVALKYPNILSKLIACGANTNPCELKKWFVVMARLGYLFTRDAKLKMMFAEPNITKDDLTRITVPTMIVAGSRDILHERYIIQLADSISNSTLCILQGESHGSYILKHNQRLYEKIQPFLKNGKNVK